jgi:hypothetical protein
MADRSEAMVERLAAAAAAVDAAVDAELLAEAANASMWQDVVWLGGSLTQLRG